MISEFPTLTPFSTPSGIITGPDGALWFAELGSFKIGRITTSGSFSEFPLATPSDRPDGIAVGSDGALWFTLGDRIGRITTGGSVSEFPIPTAGGGPEGITAGPDGALWFVEELGEDRADHDRRYCQRVPDPDRRQRAETDRYGPRRRAVVHRGRQHWRGRQQDRADHDERQHHGVRGPDRQVRTVRDRRGPRRGAVVHREGRRQDRAGHDRRQLHRVRDPNRRQRSSRDHGGPRRALWFTERAVGKIGRVTTGGSFTEFPVPTAGSVPDQITAGPDGAIWFTMNYSKIGRITVPPTTLTLSPKRRAMTSAPRTA